MKGEEDKPKAVGDAVSYENKGIGFVDGWIVGGRVGGSTSAGDGTRHGWRAPDGHPQTHTHICHVDEA